MEESVNSTAERYGSAHGMALKINAELRALRPCLTLYWARHTWATLAAQKASSLAFASSLTLTDFELCRHFSNKIKKKIQKRNKKRGYAYFG